ncbi:Regulator of chromosome condensation (RCC1) repeat protein [compost metagenome]
MFSKTDGSVWAYGRNNQYGQLGDGTTTPHTTPALVKYNEEAKVRLVYPLGTQEAPEGSNVSQPSIEWNQDNVELTTAYQVQILDEDGTVVVDSGVVEEAVTTSSNAWTVDQALPTGEALQVRVKVHDEQHWSEWSAGGWLKVQDSTTALKQNKLASGDNHSLLVKEDGSVWAWGNNQYGQLGDGTTTSKSTAVQVNGLSDVLSVAAGSYHSLALKSDGTVWSWGLKSTGQIGNEGINDHVYSRPEQVENLTGIIAIMAKGNTSYALNSDGTVWAWGLIDLGQLGIANNINANVPVQIQGVRGVSQLATSSRYTYALTNEGTVFGWGADRNNPMSHDQVIGLSDVVSIAATSSGGTGLALKKDGSVEIWNGLGYPTQVTGLSNIKAIAGGESNFAIAEDGSVWNWTNGTPTKLTGINEVSEITSGVSHVVFSKTDGSIWAYGNDNRYGQLGDGSTAPHTTPELVKDNEATKVTLAYPTGTKEAPDGSDVSQLSIQWDQEDAALTNFAAYQVQILDEDGEVVVDSGVVEQAVTASNNAWTVNQALPAGKALQVRVKVYDEQYWSEWSAVGWMKKYEPLEVQHPQTEQHLKISSPSKLQSGSDTTVTLTVYGEDGLVNSNIDGIYRVTISGYPTIDIENIGYFGAEELLEGYTSLDVIFSEGVAHIPLILHRPSVYNLLIELEGLGSAALDLEVVTN